MSWVAPAWLAKGARGLSMNIDDADADVPAPVPAPEGEAQIAATASLWLDCVDFRGPYEDVLADAGLRAAGYLVTESLYTDYGDNEFAAPRSWPDGERSPGVTRPGGARAIRRSSSRRSDSTTSGSRSATSCCS